MGGADLIAFENYSRNSALLSKSIQRLSSGLAINSASDDPSGLAIADKLRTEANSITQSIKNANSAIALTQIADKAMGEQSNILDLIKTKLVQASTSTTNDDGREAIRKDITKLLEQFDNIANSTNYNGIYLLQDSNGSDLASNTKDFQVGTNSGDTITLDSIRANTSGVNLTALKNLAANGLTQTVASDYLDDIDSALTTLNGYRSDVGSTQVQLESSTRNMMSMETSLKNAESTIRDVDYAQEVANMSRLQLLVQAGMFTIAQANKIREQMFQYLLK